MRTEVQLGAKEQLADRVRGEILEPGDAGYDEARSVWNGMIDRRPGAIVQCRGAADVIAAVDFARENDLLLAVKGGGHSVAGKSVCDGGLLIDLSPMGDVRIDPDAKTARVGAGATLADMDHETQAFGLATTLGVVSMTGVAGLTLGGGIGWLARSYGLALDNLLSADVVTADGKLVRASEKENADLFWGLRGGGGNFGVVTSFEFRLHEVGPEVLTAQAFHPIEKAPEVLRFYRDFMAEAPDEVACYAMTLHAPPEEPFPEDFQGERAIAMAAVYSGSVEDGEALLKPITEFGEPVVAAVQPVPYAAQQQGFDAAAPEGERYYWKGHFLESLSDEAIDTFASCVAPLPGPFSMAGFESLGGAVSRVDDDATAFPARKAAYSLFFQGGWSDPAQDDEHIRWVRSLYEETKPYAMGMTYVNYLDQDDEARAGYGDRYARLAEVKKAWDPDNLFQMNQNIEPSA